MFSSNAHNSPGCNGHLKSPMRVSNLRLKCCLGGSPRTRMLQTCAFPYHSPDTTARVHLRHEQSLPLLAALQRYSFKASTRLPGNNIQFPFKLPTTPSLKNGVQGLVITLYWVSGPALQKVLLVFCSGEPTDLSQRGSPHSVPEVDPSS